MDWNKILQSSLLKVGICLVLTISMVAGLFLPGLDMHAEEPTNPLQDQKVEEIELQKMGENASDLQTIVVPQGGSTPPTEPEEPDPEQTDPEETQPEETKPQDEESEEQDIDDGQEGNEENNQGEEGGQMLDLDLSAVMTWYKYGVDPKTLVCGASNAVSKSLNTAQLVDNTLKYRFDLKGTDARYVTITGVSVASGDSAYERADTNGSIEIKLPGGVGTRKYTFQVNAQAEKKNDEGQTVQQEVTFTYVITCSYSMDLEMEFVWKEIDGAEHTITCAPDKAEAFSVRNDQVRDGVLTYTTKLSGSLAEDAEIVAAEYTSASGVYKGNLDKSSGSVPLATEPGKDRDTFYLTFTVKTPERTVEFRYNLVYQQLLDAQLEFTWIDKGMVSHLLTCRQGIGASDRVKNNQLSAGSISYRMELTGNAGQSGRITKVTYASEAGSGELDPKGGYLPMSLEGRTSVTYRITVMAMVSGQNMSFEINLYCANDVMLQMEYFVVEDGIKTPRIISCENNKNRTAEPIYDNELRDGILDFKMSIVGEDADNIHFKEITCFQSGNGRAQKLSPNDDIILLLNGGKTGENTFTVKAVDSEDNEYNFNINIPFKHRGANSIQIETNLVDGQRIINGSTTNLTVRAWQEDDAGNVVNYIPATGVDTKLIVKFNDEEITYTSTSGASSSEYSLHPQNPVSGNSNTHTLYIYAEDAFGNFGEKKLELIGLRRETGQPVGTASIYVDMTVLGLGRYGPISYKVLADEPVSYVVYKAVMGQDAGEPFGKAEESFGWRGRYENALDRGFYLASLTPGDSAKTMLEDEWQGNSIEEDLEIINAFFGKYSSLAALWRCIRLNGFSKEGGSGTSFGEQEYTSGSGWMYSIGEFVSYPGQSMSEIYLNPGDVLTLRYTLAQGWDVGGGQKGYGDSHGYCVTALNGEFYVYHEKETVRLNGQDVERCKYCHLVQDCDHINKTYKDMETGEHIEYCPDCETYFNDTEELHQWTYNNEDTHVCKLCNATESHQKNPDPDTSTATCTQDGEVQVYCSGCDTTFATFDKSPGHQTKNEWSHDEYCHYKICYVCGDEVTGTHQYQYVSGDWWCQVCDCGHAWNYCGNDNLTVVEATCEAIRYYCESCDADLSMEGEFPDHDYDQGTCIYCNAPDPDYVEHSCDWQIEENILPTCVEDGWVSYFCSGCGDTWIDSIPATGEHSWETVETEDGGYRYCTVCGEEESHE